jgi:hypothetical protein
VEDLKITDQILVELEFIGTFIKKYTNRNIYWALFRQISTDHCKISVELRAQA